MRYSCPPLSRATLRVYAGDIRKFLKLENVLMFPAARFLEILHLIIGDESFHYQSIPDEEWKQPLNRHAYFDLTENCVYIKESVYMGACNGNGRDRMTIVHECAHVLLIRHSHLTLSRCFDKHVPTYCDPEWQAKCLAGELMIPIGLVQGMSINEVASRCGVSFSAAQYQLDQYNRESGQAKELDR